MYDLSSSSDASTALRSLCEGKPSDVRWRQGRPYVLAENVEFDLVTGDDGESRGTLKVTGVVRGAPMSANRLVHLQGFGDFQVSRIVSSPLKPRGPQGDGSMEVEAKVLSEPDSEKDDLLSTNEVDDMANEQTWPTEAEMEMVADGEEKEGLPDAKEGTTPKVIKRVPKGTSAYQAAWLLEDEEVDSDEGDEDESDGEGSMKSSFTFKNLDGKADGMAQNPTMEEEKEEYEEITEEQSSKAVAFEDIDMEEEKRQ